MTALSGLLRQLADGIELRGLRSIDQVRATGAQIRHRTAHARQREDLPLLVADKLYRLADALQRASDVPPPEVQETVASSLRLIAESVEGLAGEVGAAEPAGVA